MLSSGTSRSPLRRSCAVRAQHRELLCAQHDVPVLGARRTTARGPRRARLRAARGPKSARELGVVEVAAGEQRARAEKAWRRGGAATPRRTPRAVAPLRAAQAPRRRTRDRRRCSRRRDPARTSRRSRARSLAPGASSNGSSWSSASECSCWRRALGSARRGAPTGGSPARTARPWKLERVGREAARAAERAEQRPRMAAAHREVLPHREHHAALRVLERRVVHIVADVELVVAHEAVVGEAEILGVEQVEPAAPSPTFSSSTCQNQAGLLSASTSDAQKRMPRHSPRARKPRSSCENRAGLRGPSSGIDSIAAPRRRR